MYGKIAIFFGKLYVKLGCHCVKYIRLFIILDRKELVEEIDRGLKLLGNLICRLSVKESQKAYPRKKTVCVFQLAANTRGVRHVMTCDGWVT